MPGWSKNEIGFLHANPDGALKKNEKIVDKHFKREINTSQDLSTHKLTVQRKPPVLFENELWAQELCSGACKLLRFYHQASQ